MHRIEQADCFEWLKRQPVDSFEAVCTDPPYGLIEFSEKELAKMRLGRGGVWRLPPKVGGSQRDPLPRFTVLSDGQKERLRDYFRGWGELLMPALVPGAHVCVAVGVELDAEYFDLARDSIPRLAALYPGFQGQEIEAELNGHVEPFETEAQLGLALAESQVPFQGKEPNPSSSVRRCR